MSEPSPDSNSPTRVRRAVSGAAWPMRRAAWAVEERVVWAGADAARSAADGARWPFERIVWTLQRRLVWPLQDGFRGRGRMARATIAVATLALAAGAVAAGTQVGAPSTSNGSTVAAQASNTSPVRQVEVSVAPAETADAQLHGARPSFEPEAETPAAAEATAAGATDSAAAARAAADAPAPVQVNVVTEPVPEAALAVSRRFAEAFVLYEVGEADAEVRETFRETAAPSLVAALEDRPPRQPASGQAPQAEVLNVVAGPRYGRTAAVSVSLLRLGSTSELRLQLERTDSGWRVNDVRG